MNEVKTFERKGIVQINTNKWMRPKNASQLFNRAGLKVSPATINYWINEGKIDSMKIKSLDNLTLVNIYSAPEDVVKFIK